MNFSADRLSSFVVDDVPPIIYYVPNFITEEEEKAITNHIYSVPRPKWTQLSNRRLQNWGGIPHLKGMIVEKIPLWLCEYVERISSLGVFEVDKSPNHVLINEYLPGQGIMPHLDGPLFYPTVTTISLGSHTVLEFCELQHSTADDDNKDEECNISADSSEKKKRRKCLSLLLERRSLLILQKQMYCNYLHSISNNHEDCITDCIKNLHVCGEKYSIGQSIKRETRLSLTIRHVPKTSKVLIKLSR